MCTVCFTNHPLLQMLRPCGVGLRSNTTGMADSQEQVCVSKLSASMDDAQVVLMTGVARSGGLPIWMECKVAMTDPGMREMRASQSFTLPSGRVAHEASRLAELLGEACVDIEEAAGCTYDETLDGYQDLEHEGLRLPFSKLRAAMGLARGLVYSASQTYSFDESFDQAGLVRDDLGVRMNTAVGASDAMREAARAGLGSMRSRRGTIYTADLGVSSQILVDKWLSAISPGAKAEVVDASMQGGYAAALAELKHQLSKQEIRVAMSPLVSSRLDQAFPSCWEAWEEAVRREMWLVMDGVAGTGEPAVWRSAMGVNWQVSFVANYDLIFTWRVLDPVPSAQLAGAAEGGLQDGGGNVLHRLPRQVGVGVRRERGHLGRHRQRDRRPQGARLDVATQGGLWVPGQCHGREVRSQPLPLGGGAEGYEAGHSEGPEAEDEEHWGAGDRPRHGRHVGRQGAAGRCCRGCPGAQLRGGSGAGAVSYRGHAGQLLVCVGRAGR